MNSTDLKIASALIFLPCPSCEGKLQYLQGGEPTNVGCTVCEFKARYLMVDGSPSENIFVADTSLLAAHIEKGGMLPPLLINFHWVDDKTKHEQVTFFPFFPVKYFRNAVNPIALLGVETPHVALFRLNEVESSILSVSPSDEEIAEMLSNKKNISTSWIQREYGIGYAHSARIMDIVNEIKKKRGEAVEEDDSEGE